MRPKPHYHVLDFLFKPLSGRHRQTLGLVLTALVESKVARSMEIAQKICGWLSIRLDSALNRFYRLLRNSRVDWLALSRQVLALLASGLGPRPLIAVDWTEWPNNMRMLVASVVTGRRGIPVLTQAFDRTLMPRSQNSRENTFIRLLASMLRDLSINAVVVADRGFRRASWIKLLDDLGLLFVQRLMDDVHVRPQRAETSRALKDFKLRRGQMLDLGVVELRKEGSVKVRVIGLWARRAKQPWWLATNLQDPPALVAAFFGRRTTVEEQLRDTKGCRFGVRLKWTMFRTPDHISRFAQLVGIAIMVWTAMGVFACRHNGSLQHPHPTKGPRQSYVTIGARLVATIPKRRVTKRWVASNLPKPELRYFEWLSPAPDCSERPA